MDFEFCLRKEFELCTLSIKLRNGHTYIQKHKKEKENENKREGM